MAVYIILAFIPLYIYIGYRYVKQKRAIVFIPFIYMLCIAGLRSSNIGADYKTYIGVFNAVVRGSTGAFEIGWRCLNRVATMITSDYHVLGVMVSLVILLLVFFSICNVIPRNLRWLSFVIYIFQPYLYIQYNFNVLRQGIAAAIVLVSFQHYLKNKSLIRLIVGIILAATFHKSAIFTLILVLFIKVTIGKNFHYICMGASFVISVLVSDSRTIAIVTRYIGYERYSAVGDTMFNFLLYKIFILVIGILVCMRYEKLFHTEEEKFCVDTYIFSLSLLETLVVNDIAYRVYLYFALLHVVIFPIMYSNIENLKNKKSVRYISLAYYMVFYISFFVSMLMSKNEAYVPYRFWR